MSKKNTSISITKKNTERDDILFIFYKYFRTSDYIVTYIPEEGKEGKESKKYILISSVFSPSNSCIELAFNKKEMIIYEIHRCLFTKTESISNSSKGIGNSILKNLIKIAKTFNLKNIRLWDTSTIQNPYKSGFNISLFIYKILIEGESWYNKNGFKNENHDIEKKEWDIMRNETFIIIFLKFKDITIKKQILEKKTDVIKVLNKYSNLQNNMFIFLEKYSIKYTFTVEDVFKKLEKIRLTLEGKKIINDFYFNLEGLIDLFEDNIKYSPDLILII